MTVAHLRAYPVRFAQKLHQLHQEHTPDAHLPLRQKDLVNANMLSDRELFSNMPLGDVWVDAHLPTLYLYLFENPNLKISDSWLAPMMELKDQLQGYASWLNS